MIVHERRLALVPVGLLLVGVRHTQHRGFGEWFAGNVESDRQPRRGETVGDRSVSVPRAPRHSEAATGGIAPSSSNSRLLHKLAADSQLHGSDAVDDFPELVQGVVVKDVDEPLDASHMVLQGFAHSREA